MKMFPVEKLFLVFSILFIGTLAAQNQNEVFNGRVKSCEEMILGTSGKISSKKIISYDEKGRILTEKNYDYPGKKVSDSLIYHYNSFQTADTISCALFFGKTDPGDSSIYIYNKEGKISECRNYHAFSKKNYSGKIYVYKSGQLVSDTTFNIKQNENCFSAENYFYDARGNVSRKEMKTICKDRVYPLSDYDNFEYHSDSLGNDTLQLHYCYSVFARDSMRLCETYHTTFDKHGNVLTMIKYDGAGKTFENYSIIYQYDSQGNWIRQTKSYNGYRQNYPAPYNEKIVTTRKIEYF